MNETHASDGRASATRKRLLRIFGWTAGIALAGGLIAAELYFWPRGIQQRLDAVQEKQERMEREIAALRAMADRAGGTTAPAGESIFHIYGPDRDRRREEVVFSLSLPDGMPLLEKLRVLAEKLSTYQFSGLPIEVVRIEKYGGRNIAAIDLRDSEDGKLSWRTTCFEDRIAGYFAGASLKKTFLQEEYAGPWVDGVEFTYNGQPIFNDWPHVGISGTLLRQTPR